MDLRVRGVAQCQSREGAWAFAEHFMKIRRRLGLPGPACRGSVARMEPLELVIVVILVGVIVLASMASAWYFAKNLRHYRNEVAESDQRWRRDRDDLE